jgi:hypothetical protein
LPWLGGKNGFKRSICSSVSHKGLHITPPSVREPQSRRPGDLKRSIAPEPKAKQRTGPAGKGRAARCCPTQGQVRDNRVAIGTVARLVQGPEGRSAGQCVGADFGHDQRGRRPRPSGNETRGRGVFCGLLVDDFVTPRRGCDKVTKSNEERSARGDAKDESHRGSTRAFADRRGLSDHANVRRQIPEDAQACCRLP